MQHTHTITVRSIFSQIFNAIIHMRHTTYNLQNTHAIETKPHTHMPPSGQSPLRSIINAIIHMRQTTYFLQNTHSTGKKAHRVRCLQVPSRNERRLTAVFEVNVQSVNVPVPPVMYTAPPYKGTTTKPHTRTHTCHRQVNLLSDRS